MGKIFSILVLIFLTAGSLIAEEQENLREIPPLLRNYETEVENPLLGAAKKTVETLMGIPFGNYIESFIGAANYAEQTGSPIVLMLALYMDVQVYLGEMAQFTFKGIYQTYNFQAHILRPTFGLNLKPFENTDFRGLYFPLYTGCKWRSDTGTFGLNLNTGLGYRFSLFGLDLDFFLSVVGLTWSVDNNTFAFSNPWDNIGMAAGLGL